jgi:hypothetical protein
MPVPLCGSSNQPAGWQVNIAPASGRGLNIRECNRRNYRFIHISKFSCDEMNYYCFRANLIAHRLDCVGGMGLKNEFI